MIITSIETRSPDALHEAAFIDTDQSGLSRYAVAVCGAEFRDADGWVSARCNTDDVTCPECQRRGERRTRKPIQW